jgi:hypothetical protein
MLVGWCVVASVGLVVGERVGASVVGACVGDFVVGARVVGAEVGANVVGCGVGGSVAAPLERNPPNEFCTS